MAEMTRTNGLTAEPTPFEVYVSYDRTLVFEPMGQAGFDYPICGVGVMLQYKHPFLVSDMEHEPEGAEDVNGQLRMRYDPTRGFSIDQSESGRPVAGDWTVEALFVMVETAEERSESVNVSSDVFQQILDRHGTEFPADGAMQSVSYSLSRTSTRDSDGGMELPCLAAR